MVYACTVAEAGRSVGQAKAAPQGYRDNVEYVVPADHPQNLVGSEHVASGHEHPQTFPRTGMSRRHMTSAYDARNKAKMPSITFVRTASAGGIVLENDL